MNRCASERRPGVSSVRQGPSPRDALSSARLRPSRRRGFATATPAIDVVGPARAFLGSRAPSPRPRVPLPAGGALLWARDIACRLLQPYTTRGHTRRASDPRARAGLSLRCSPAAMPAALACPIRFASHRAAREPRPVRALGRSVRVKESAQPSANDFARPSSLNSRHPGRRCVRLAGPGTSRKRGTPTEIHVRCRLAKSDAAQRIKAPSAETELLRERRSAPPFAPEPRLRHAASAEALLWSAHTFLTCSSPPATDEVSG